MPSQAFTPASSERFHPHNINHHQPSSDATSRLLGANCTMLLRIRHIGLLSLSKNDGETHTSRKCVNRQYQQGLDTNNGSIHFKH